MPLKAINYPVCVSGVLTPRPSPGKHCQPQLKEFAVCDEGKSTEVLTHLSPELHYSFTAGSLVFCLC